MIRKYIRAILILVLLVLSHVVVAQSKKSDDNTDTTNNEIVAFAEKMPVFEGGYRAYISKNLRYPA